MFPQSLEEIIKVPNYPKFQTLQPPKESCTNQPGISTKLCNDGGHLTFLLLHKLHDQATMTSKFMNMQLVYVTSSSSTFMTRLEKSSLFHIAKISHFFNVTILVCFYCQGSELKDSCERPSKAFGVLQNGCANQHSQ
jgi:hypothetical protein